jgi:hypothetical protein
LEKLISSQTAGPGGAKPVVEEEAAPDAEAKPEPKKAGAAKDLPANR